MADLRISELAALAGANLAAGDLLAIADASASETKKITVTDLVGNATTLIADATIPGAKILFNTGQIGGTAITAGTLGTAQLTDDAVTAAKLANESTVDLVTTLPASGAFVGQLALDTDDSKVYCWNGTSWVSFKAAGSINTVIGDSAGLVNLTVATSGDQVTITTSLDNTGAAAQFLAGPTADAGAVSYRAIAGADLPTATTSAKGGVIVNGNGLAMSGDTITIDNSVTAETSIHHIVQYDANGLITAGRAIIGADVPLATASVVGVSRPGSGLNIDGSGTLNHANSITGGTGTKVTFDTEGHIVSDEALVDTDIPNLPASKITSGTFDAARLGSKTVSGAKIADYTVSLFGEAQPTAEHIGQFFFNPLTRDLFLWDGNVYQPVGISAGEIILAGTYNANTNLLDSVTAEGAAAGFISGSALPAAATENSRYYVVVSQSGTGTAPAPTVSLEPPDILLSNGSSYILIETSETITAQTASNVSFSATGNIASTNVQGAIVELDNEKVSKAGDTMTGNLLLDDANLVFEGATANDFETTLTVVDPTADRTITLPNASGTVLLSGAGGIVNADISASAEIAVSKLADGDARQLLQTDAAGTGVEWASNIDIPGTLDVTGAATFDSSVAVTGALTKSGSNVVTVGDTGTVTSTMILNGTIVDADINASAAIAKTKISGTAITAADTGTVTSTMIADGTIVDGDINAAASISASKIEAATTTNAGVVQLTDSTSSTSTTTAATPNSVKSAYDLANAAFPANGGAITGDVTLNAQVDLRFADSDSSNWVAFQAPATIASNVTWTLPAADGTSGQVLSTDGAGALSWATAAGGGGDKIEEGNTSAEVIDTGSDGRFVVTTEGTERLRCDSSGRLLVGTSSTLAVGSESHILQTETTGHSVSHTRHGGTLGAAGPVFSFARSRGTTAGSVTAVVDGDNLGYIMFHGANGTDFSNRAAWIACEVDGTPFSGGDTTDLPGRLVFSTTADGASSPVERMRIDNVGSVFTYNASGNSFEVGNGQGAGTTNALLVGRYSSTATANGTNSILVWTNGNIQNTNNSYGAISDIKLKENIVDASSQWDDLKALQVRNYNFKEGQTHTQIGLVAQEVELVSPGLVSESPDRDEEGNDLGATTKSVNYSVLYMKAVKALQEAMERIETLEAKVAALEGV